MPTQHTSDIVMPAHGELVPLGTQILSPALAEAFSIPFAPSEQPAGAHLLSGHLPSAISAEQKPTGASRYNTYTNGLERSSSHAQAGPAPDPAEPFEPYGPGARPSQHAQRKDTAPPFRDQSGPIKWQEGGAAGPPSAHNGWQEAYAGPEKHKLQYTEPLAPKSAGSLDTAGEEHLARALKRPRLVWTSQLHARFVEAVNQLGLKSAVPKTIMQLMGVEGLTRENVASHLQKYRLQLRKEGRDIVDSHPADRQHHSTMPFGGQHQSDSEGEHEAEHQEEIEPEEAGAPAMQSGTGTQQSPKASEHAHPSTRALQVGHAAALHRSLPAHIAAGQMQLPSGASPSFVRMLERQPSHPPGIRL